MVSAIGELTRSRELRLETGLARARADHFFPGLQLRHLRIPQHEPVDSHIGATQTVDGGFERGHRRVGEPSAENYIRGGDDAGSTALNVAGRRRDDDEVVASLHPRELASYFIHDLRLG